MGRPRDCRAGALPGVCGPSDLPVGAPCCPPSTSWHAARRNRAGGLERPHAARLIQGGAGRQLWPSRKWPGPQQHPRGPPPARCGSRACRTALPGDPDSAHSHWPEPQCPCLRDEARGARAEPPSPPAEAALSPPSSSSNRDAPQAPGGRQLPPATVLGRTVQAAHASEAGGEGTPSLEPPPARQWGEQRAALRHRVTSALPRPPPGSGLQGPSR